MTDEKKIPETEALVEAPAVPTQAAPADDTKTSQHTNPKKPSATKPVRAGNGGVWLALILLVAVLMYGAWYLAQQYMVQQNLLASLQEQVQQQERSLALQKQTLEADIDQQIARQKETVQESLNEMAQRLDSTAARVLAMSSVNRDDWKLAEAEYLLRLANQRVLLERNSGNAVALAQTVDEILRDLNDPDLFPIRRALAAELSELKLAGDIDREGVYLRLLALSQQLDKLPLIEPLGENEEPWLLDEDGQSEATSIWARVKRKANSLLRLLGNHLRVRDHAQPVPAILPPDNRIYLKQNLRLMLEQAQSALLREEAEVYQASLEKANTWLAEYFPLNPQSVAAQAEIAELQNAVIAQTLPNFSESTLLLKSYIERKHKVPTARRGGI